MDKRSFLDGRDHSIDPRNRPAPAYFLRENAANLLDDCIEENEGSTESLASIGSKSDDSASVYLRLRPATNHSKYTVDNNMFTIFNDVHTKEKQYTFSDVLNFDISQRDVYNICVNSSIENDDNLTLLMYGTSGSGKTFTLMGDADQPGVIPRAIEHIFTRYNSCISKTPKIKPEAGVYRFLSDDEIETEKARRLYYLRSQNGSIFSGDMEKIQGEHDFVELKPKKAAVYVWISFFEIYNENIKDLLENPSANSNKKREGLTVMSNSGRAFVKDLTSVFTVSSDEATELLTRGLNQRLNASTSINSTSSRSHCLFLIDVIKNDGTGLFHNKYKFCDLAGSERVKKSETTGLRLKETLNINTSLLVLGRCLDITLANQKKKKADIVPFRESKLTTFLQSALNGTEKLTMIVNIWPVVKFYEENINVLNYAAMAQNIIHRRPVNCETHSTSPRRYTHLFENQLQPNVNTTILLDDNFRLRNINDELIEENNNLWDENDRLRRENSELRRISASIESKIRAEMTNTLMTELKAKEKAVEARLQIRIDFLTKRYEDDIAQLKKKLQKQDEELSILYEEVDEYYSSNESGSSSNDSDVIAIED